MLLRNTQHHVQTNPSSESLCIQIAFWTSKPRLLFNAAAAPVTMATGSDTVALSFESSVWREPNPIWQFLQKQVINSPQFDLQSHIAIIFLSQILRLIFPQLHCGRDTWDRKCDGLSPRRRYRRSAAVLNYDPPGDPTRDALTWPMLLHVTVLVLQAAELPAQLWC